MKKLLPMLLLFITNGLLAQILKNDDTKVNPRQVVDFKYTDCQHVHESTLEVAQFPHFLRLTDPVKRFNSNAFIAMNIYFAANPKGSIYKFRNGFVRGGNRLSIPLPEPGIYFVRLETSLPTPLVIDAQTTTIRIKHYEWCKSNAAARK
jgi:hypothetical protein